MIFLALLSFNRSKDVFHSQSEHRATDFNLPTPVSLLPPGLRSVPVTVAASNSAIDKDQP